MQASEFLCQRKSEASSSLFTAHLGSQSQADKTAPASVQNCKQKRATKAVSNNFFVLDLFSDFGEQHTQNYPGYQRFFSLNAARCGPEAEGNTKLKLSQYSVGGRPGNTGTKCLRYFTFFGSMVHVILYPYVPIKQVCHTACFYRVILALLYRPPGDRGRSHVTRKMKPFGDRASCNVALE